MIQAARLVRLLALKNVIASATASKMFMRRSSLIQIFRTGGKLGSSSGKSRTMASAISRFAVRPKQARISAREKEAERIPSPWA